MNKIKITILSTIILFLFCFVYYMTYNLVEPRAYDYMTKHFLTEKLPFDAKKQVYGSDDIVLIVVDAKTAEKYRWPWKRDKWCKIIDYLHNYTNAKVILHDIIITTPDRDNPDSDNRFLKSVNNTPNLIEGFLPSIKQWKNDRYDKKFINKFGIKVEDKSHYTPLLYESLYPYPESFLDSINNVGSVDLSVGFINGNNASGFRTYEYLFKYSEGFLPSMALKAFLLLNNNPEVVLTNNKIKFPDLNYEISINKTYWQSLVPIRFYKFYADGYSHKKYSAVDIMDSYDAIIAGKKALINPSEFNDKIILIGGNVPAGDGLNDNKTTPMAAMHPGVDIQATAIDNIIHNDFVKVVPYGINILIAIIGMLLVYCYIRVSDLTKSIVSTIVIILSYLALAIICFYFQVVINVITPLVMFILTTILAYTHKFVLENKSKEKVKTAMGKYMSQDVMKRVIQNIDNLGLGGKKSVVTVLFSDIRGFTSMSEQMSAQEVSEFLNEYFSEMEPIVTKYNGVINKFIGDAVMAVFGEPIQDKSHAKNAVKCAYEMLQKVKELQIKFANEGKPKIEIGIGINTGEVFVGNIGSVNRMEYTVIGDTVNLASRLESYNKIYKTTMLISPTTFNEVKGFVDVIKISDVQIRGKANKMDIYEVLRVNE